jgi:hypothetical protein
MLNNGFNGIKLKYLEKIWIWSNESNIIEMNKDMYNNRVLERFLFRNLEYKKLKLDSLLIFEVKNKH